MPEPKPAVARPLLVAKALHKTFSTPRTDVSPAREIRVLTGLELTITAGEMVSIVGLSGVGKSTLLHILGTLDKPTSGRVLYTDRDVFAMSANELAAFRNRNIGFVFQFHHLLAEFTALENVMLPALIHGLGRAEGMKRAKRLLAAVGLAERIAHKPGELSGGEQQRVALARALVMEPRVVFADEPTGNLDTGTSEEIHELLVRLNRETGTAFVVVTHNVRLAWMMNRHLLLSHGVVRELAPDEAPEEFLPKTSAKTGGPVA